MRGRALLVAATAWLAVVLVGSTVVWAVISRAGERVVPSSPEAAGVGAGAGRSPAGIDTPASSHEPSRRPSSRPASPAPPTGGASSPSTTTSPSDSAPPPTSPSQPVQHSSSPSTPPPQPALRSGSWSGAAGFVYAECRATRIVTVTAQADSGWSVQVEERGPEELKVKFASNGENSPEVEVTGHCVGGVPRFDGEGSGGGGGDDSADD